MAAYDSPAGPPKSLRETFDTIRAAHARKAYLALRPYVEPESRNAVIDLLLTVDRLLAANASALKALQRVCPDAPRERFDLSGVIADNLEIFSEHVEVTGQPTEDRQAGQGSIRILIARDPTPVRVDFRLHDGHWLYAPGRGVEKLTAGYSELAKALDRVARSLACSDHLTSAEVAYKYNLFIVPKLKQLAPSVAER